MGDVSNEKVNGDKGGNRWYLVFMIYGEESRRDELGDFIVEESIYLVSATGFLEAYHEGNKWASPSQVRHLPSGETVSLPLMGVLEIMPVWEPFQHGSELGYRHTTYSSSWQEVIDSLLEVGDVQDLQIN